MIPEPNPDMTPKSASVGSEPPCPARTVDQDEIAAMVVRTATIETVARLLHEASCRDRGVEAMWTGRRTNRAHYRRLARARIDAAKTPAA